MKPIPADIALRAVRRMADAANVELVMPDDARRLAIVYGLAAAHAMTGDGWDVGYAKENVSVTLPGLGQGVDLLRMVPYVGGVFADVARDLRRPMISLSPRALSEGVLTVGVYKHEEGHLGDIRRGGLLWCLSYGAILGGTKEVRAGAEAPCYGTNMAHRVLLGGVSVDEAEADANASLAFYGLDPASRTLALGTTRSNAESLRHGADPGGVVAESFAALVAEGWTP